MTTADDTLPDDADAPDETATPAPDTAPDPATSPVAPAPTPPGDFANSPFWASPSTYLTFGTFLLPLFTWIFGPDEGKAVLDSVTAAAPGVAMVVLVIVRNANHRNVQRLNAALAQQRLAQQQNDDHARLRAALDDAQRRHRAYAEELATRPPARKAAPRKAASRRATR